MSRNHLLENGYNFRLIEPKKHLIKILWAIFALVFLAANAGVFLAVLSDSLSGLPLPYVEFGIYVTNILFVALPFIYFMAKSVLAVLCCTDQTQNMALKADETGGPSLKIKEALKTRQIVLIYFVPALAMSVSLFAITLISGGNLNFFILVFIMAIFMSYDFTLVVFVLALKIAYRPDYIGINNHVYSMTLYSKGYAADGGGAKQTKKYRPKPGLPDFALVRKMSPAQKRLGLLAAAVLVFAGVAVYSSIKRAKEEKQPDIDDFATYLAYCDAMKPAIRGYGGDPMAIPGTAPGEGFKRLAGGNIIHCNDDGSAIYFDKGKNAVMRLDSGGKSERLCVYEKCRGNPDQKCGHIPEFVGGGVYADGFLYGARQYMATDKKGREVLRAYVIRYDTGSNTMDKLIEFERGEEDAYIRNMVLDGGFLYVWVSAGYDAFAGRELTEETEMLDLGVVKIDLGEESACVLYSEGTQRKDYVLNLSRFCGGYIFGAAPKSPLAVPYSSVPVGGVIYRCGLDIKSFAPVVDLGYFLTTDGEYVSICARQFDIYGDAIYYTTTAGSELYRHNMRLTQSSQSESETLFDNVSKFCIDGGYLYYDIAYAKGDGSHRTNVIYKTKIEEYYMDFSFNSAFAAYVPEEGTHIGAWDVHGGDIYVALRVGSTGRLSRVKSSSNAEPYVFW